MAQVPYARRRYEPDYRMGDLIRSQGRNAAEAELRRGDISAQLWANVGRSISDTVGNIVQARADEPRREAEQLKLEQQKRTMKQDATANALMPFALQQREDGLHTFDRDLLTREYTAAGMADRLPSLLQALDGFEASALSLKKLHAEMGAAKTDAIANLAYGVLQAGSSPEAVKLAIEMGAKNGIVTQKEVSEALTGMTPDPQSITERMTILANQSPKVSALLQKPDKDKPVVVGNRLVNPTNGSVVYEPPTPPAPTPESRLSGEDLLAYLAAQGNEGAKRALAVKRAQRPQEDDQPLVPIVGPDGKTRYGTRAEARGQLVPSSQQKPATGLEKRALNFFNRAQQADVDLEGMEDDIQQMGLFSQGWMALAPNFAQSQLGQSYTQAQRAFTEARLRKDSGAAIPPQEFENDRKTYFAQPGDSQETLEQKRRARAAILASLGFESGQALGEFLGDGEEAARVIKGYRDRSQAPVSVNQVPKGELKPGTSVTIGGFTVKVKG